MAKGDDSVGRRSKGILVGGDRRPDQQELVGSGDPQLLGLARIEKGIGRIGQGEDGIDVGGLYLGQHCRHILDVRRVAFVDFDLNAGCLQGRHEELEVFLTEGQDIGNDRGGLDPGARQHGRQLRPDLIRDRRGREPNVARLHLADRDRGCRVADHGKAMLLYHAGHIEVMRGTPGGEQQIHLVIGDQLFVDLGRLRRV